MERKDQRDYREQRAETWRGSDPQSQEYRGQDRSERQQFGDMERSAGRQYDPTRERWETQGTSAFGENGRGYEGGRQYESGEYQRGGGGYGYGRQAYPFAQPGYGYSGQPGYGHYGARPSEDTGAGYAGRETWREPSGQYGRYPYAATQYGQYSGRGPRNYLRSDDRIRDDVCYRLTDDPIVDASNIDVIVVTREVTLSGTVPSRDQRRRAEDVAEQVSGVSHVQNNIRVSRPEARQDIPRDETEELISSKKVEGTSVYGADRQKIGSIESVMITKRSGRVAYAVLSFGGFLGLGTEYYPLPWHMLKYEPDLGGYMINLTKDQLQNAPKYGPNDSWDWNDRDTSRRIDQYYGQWMGTYF